MNRSGLRVIRKASHIESVEAPDGSWWVIRRGGKSPQTWVDEADISSVVGDVRVDNTPYPARLVGYGQLPSSLHIIGFDEATDQPIVDAASLTALIEAGWE